MISPLLANLFLHYVFDQWMRRHHPDVPFERYADDVLCYCRTRQQAEQVLQRLTQRFAGCGLTLHPQKTRLVYCKDDDRRGEYPETSFDFLGYTFRARRSKNRWGKFFVNFSPGMSAKAGKRIRQEVRGWKLPARSDKTLDDLARMFDKQIRGWVNYYGVFYKSALYPTLRHLDRKLVLWATRKYKRLRGHRRRAAHWLERIAREKATHVRALAAAMGKDWDGKSRMSREIQVRFCEHLEGRFLRVTRLVILVHGTQQQAEAERDALAKALHDGMGLTLSPDKTRITDPADGFQFLGHRVSMRWDDRFGWSPRIEVPKPKAADLRHKVKQLTTRQTLHWSLDDLLQKLNPILRGWAHFYCYCTGAKDVLGGLDWYVRDRVWRWMRKKHPEASVRWLLRHRRPSRHRPTRRVWQGERHEQYQMGWLKVQRYKRRWMTPPDFTVVPGEPDA